MENKGKIQVIGGGEIKDLETLIFDKRNVQLTGKKHPKALFVPTASGEPQGYINTFNEVYGKRLGCKTDVLYLLNEIPSKKQLKDKIFSSDLVYVGGGNTLRMMKRWRYLGVDKILKKAYEKGVVLSGLSAGGVCWFEYGHSDSMSFYNPENWNYIKVSGLGILEGIHCPHFDKNKRKEQFGEFIKKHSGIGIAIENNCAIEFIGGQYRVNSSKADSNAYRVSKSKGEIKIEKIPKKKDFSPIEGLYNKK